jgi:hypothetical protein
MTTIARRTGLEVPDRDTCVTLVLRRARIGLGSGDTVDMTHGPAAGLAAAMAAVRAS